MLSKSNQTFLWSAWCAILCFLAISFMAWCVYGELREYTPDPVMTTQEYSASVMEKRIMEDDR